MSLRGSLRVECAFLGVTVLVLLLAAHPQPAPAEPLDAAAAERLVREMHVEGIPYAQARALSADATERLIQMLRDPGEAEHHGNIVMALGISRRPGAYGALLELAERDHVGEVSSDTYLARRVIPLAMGHLASTDPRALRFLVERVRPEKADAVPAWSHRHLRGEKLAGILHRAVITGLAISGRTEAEAMLRDMEDAAGREPKTSDELRTHLAEARVLCARVMSEGPDPVFGRGRGPVP